MTPPALGLRANARQFALLVGVNALVGATIGLERTLVPVLATTEFGLTARTSALSFIAVFGVAKAAANYLAGRLSDRFGRRSVLIAGWLVALPFPFLMMWAPTWGWVLAANALLGVSQGLTWSTTVVMKIDLAGPQQRGLAMGLNEFAGYLALAASALATGWLAAATDLRPTPFWLGVGFVAAGTILSALLVRETRGHVALEVGPRSELSARAVFARATWSDPALSSAAQAGFVNNLNDGMAWGLFPLLYTAAGLDLPAIGALAAIYPAVWGTAQLVTGWASDRTGRKGWIVAGMAVQAAAIAVVVTSTRWPGFAAGNALLGLGTAMVYPTLLAAVGDAAEPAWRASAVGVYRLWRDLGYAAGALLAGSLADALGLSAAIWIVAGLTLASGAGVALRMPGRAQSRQPQTYTRSPRDARRPAPSYVKVTSSVEPSA